MSYIYLVQIRIPADHEAEFNRIYDEEHVPTPRTAGTASCNASPGRFMREIEPDPTLAYRVWLEGPN
jgi:hypothetical protein